MSDEDNKKMLENRRAFLNSKAKEFDTQVEFAEKLGYQPNYLNQLLLGRRPITEKTARSIEKILKLRRYEMDFSESDKPATKPIKVNELEFTPYRGKIPVIPFKHSEITKLINSPNVHTGEFMNTFVEVGKKSFAVILDDRHRRLDPPGTVIVFDPDAEPTFEKECFVLVSFPADPEYYEIMRYIKHEGKPSVENLSGRHQPMSISSTGAIIHARAVKRIGDM